MNFVSHSSSDLICSILSHYYHFFSKNKNFSHSNLALIFYVTHINFMVLVTFGNSCNVKSIMFYHKVLIFLWMLSVASYVGIIVNIL